MISSEAGSQLLTVHAEACTPSAQGGADDDKKRLQGRCGSEPRHTSSLPEIYFARVGPGPDYVCQSRFWQPGFYSGSPTENQSSGGEKREKEKLFFRIQEVDGGINEQTAAEVVRAGPIYLWPALLLLVLWIHPKMIKAMKMQAVT